MSWRSEWNALSARISGAIDAGRFYLAVVSIDKHDKVVADKLLIPQAIAIIETLRNFRKIHSSRLPRDGLACLDRELAKAEAFTSGKGYFGVEQTLTYLAMLRAEFDHAIADHSAIARSLTERAFSHLQRSLIADESLRERWRAAFAKREEHCERLGAVHLLSHGIWAFKANAADKAGRTDLILGTPMRSTDEAERSAEALVLTEWKKVQAEDDPGQKADEAQEQAQLYAAGVLGAFELAEARYIVLVSRDMLSAIEDRQAGEVTYRVVNIAIEPSTPSAAARRRSR